MQLMQKGPNDYRREGLATMDYIKKLSAIYSRQNLINLWKTDLYLLSDRNNDKILILVFMLVNRSPYFKKNIICECN